MISYEFVISLLGFLCAAAGSAYHRLFHVFGSGQKKVWIQAFTTD